MSKMRGVAEFAELWERRTTLQGTYRKASAAHWGRAG